jgi:hypothetical protein
MLFASSASAGQRFAICAVSNCVRFGSRRSVLEKAKKRQRMITSHQRRKVGLWPTHSRTALAESVVLNLAKVFTYSRVLLYTLHYHHHFFKSEKLHVQMNVKLTTHAVSGASLSRFSRRYFTSEMRRHPALLNSVWNRQDNIRYKNQRTWAYQVRASARTHLPPRLGACVAVLLWTSSEKVGRDRKPKGCALCISQAKG